MNQLKHIIEKCISQDRLAQQQLYEYSYKHLSTAVALYTKDQSEKDWIFNLGMLKVFKSLEKYTTGTNYLGWARTILVRTAIDAFRKKKTEDIMAPLVHNEADENLQELNAALNAIETNEIIGIIQRLPEKERIVFTMFEMDGYSHIDIEREVGIKKNTSKWLLSKARKSLKEIIINSPSLNHYFYGK
ncbi:MAG: RNA polymerase sigma factor [Saprospiraceae bacterium]|nr:RNA polymerase sigma factor [Bacteroidia bacterium]NNE16780.1 RNA polymerase sigma factor [Saprospiraceae bacterium]NNL92832.1 RNA polymerase sigma factor [Saprospiraceae bacterium]